MADLTDTAAVAAPVTVAFDAHLLELSVHGQLQMPFKLGRARIVPLAEQTSSTQSQPIRHHHGFSSVPSGGSIDWTAACLTLCVPVPSAFSNSCCYRALMLVAERRTLSKKSTVTIRISANAWRRCRRTVEVRDCRDWHHSVGKRRVLSPFRSCHNVAHATLR